MQEKTLEYYMGLPYTVEIRHNEDGYFAKILELPGCMTWAETFEELEPRIEGAMEAWIGCGLAHGDRIPEPSGRAES